MNAPDDIAASNARVSAYWQSVGGHPPAGHMDAPSLTEHMDDTYGVRIASEWEAALLTTGDAVQLYRHHIDGGLYDGVVRGHTSEHVNVLISRTVVSLPTDDGTDPDFDSRDEDCTDGEWFLVLSSATPKAAPDDRFIGISL